MLELRLAISLVPSSVRLLLLNYKPSVLAVLNMLSPVISMAQLSTQVFPQ